MNRSRLCIPAALALAALLAPTPARPAGEAKQLDEWIAIPLRIRDLTFPTVLVMGFKPRPVELTFPRRWAFELDYSVANNFQASEGVEAFLAERGGGRRPLSTTDVENMASRLDGDHFLIDGEFGLLDFGIHYGVTERVVVSIRLSHISYGGGLLDNTIFDFHDEFGFEQDGRQYLENDQFQIFLKNGTEVYSLLEPSTSGGFIDPTISISYSFPDLRRGWSLGLEAGAKVPLADDESLLSSGSSDVGAQLTLQKELRRSALILNLAYVDPGTFKAAPAFDPPHLPSVNVTYLRRLGRGVTGVLQLFYSENIFREKTDSALAELEFQLSGGFQFEVLGGLFGVGITENIFNFDNTPDVALHLSFGLVVRRKDGRGADGEKA